MESEKKDQSPEEQYQKALTTAASENSALRGFIRDYIRLKLAQAQQSADTQQVKNIPIGKNDLLVQEPEIAEYKKFYQEALAEFADRVRKNPRTNEASDVGFKTFLDRFEKCFIWSDILLDENSNIDGLLVREGDASSDTIGVCTIIPPGVRHEHGDGIVNIKQGDAYPHIAIYPYPVSKTWAAILLLRKLAQVYEREIGLAHISDEEQKDRLAYIYAITNLINLIDCLSEKGSFSKALARIVLARKIKTIGQLAALIGRESKLSIAEVKSLENMVDGQTDNISKMEKKEHLIIFNECLMVLYLMLDLEAQKGEIGSHQDWMLEKFNQLGKILGWERT